MTAKKVSDFDAADPLDGTETFGFVQGTENRKATLADIVQYIAELSVFQMLVDGATIAWDMADGFNAKVTLGGDRAIGTPTNPIEGQTYTLQIIQDGTGSRTITDWGVIDFGDAGDPTLSTGAGAIDFIYMQCIESSGPTFRATFNKG